MSLNLDCFASVYFRTHIVKLFLFFKGMCQGDDEVLSMETVVINVNLKVISVFVYIINLVKYQFVQLKIRLLKTMQ